MLRIKIKEPSKRKLEEHGWKPYLTSYLKDFGKVHVFIDLFYSWYTATIFNQDTINLPSPDELIAICEDIKKVEKRKYERKVKDSKNLRNYVVEITPIKTSEARLKAYGWVDSGCIRYYNNYQDGIVFSKKIFDIYIEIILCDGKFDKVSICGAPTNDEKIVIKKELKKLEEN